MRIDGKYLQYALNILAFLVGLVTLFSLYIWLSEFSGGQENPFVFGTPFTLAQVAAIFGGLGLIAGFAGHRDSQLQRKMRLIGNLYLFSALGFTLFGLMLPIENWIRQGDLDVDPLIGWIVTAELLVAIVAFVAGTFIWIRSIIGLIGEDKPDDCTGSS